MSDRRQRHEDFMKERRRGDRRQHPRSAATIAMELTAGGDVYFHVSANISVGGAFFDRAIPHTAGTKVELIFQLPGEDPAPVRCKGEVVDPPDGQVGLGVRFEDLSDEDRTRIAEYVTHRDAEQAAAEG